MAREREDAVEAERLASQKRANEAAERYEASSQQARMRVVAEHDRKLQELENDSRQERRRLQEQLSAAADRLEEMQQAHAAELPMSRDAARKEHLKALQVLSIQRINSQNQIKYELDTCKLRSQTITMKLS